MQVLHSSNVTNNIQSAMSHLQLDEYGRLPFDGFKVRSYTKIIIATRLVGHTSFLVCHVSIAPTGRGCRLNRRDRHDQLLAPTRRVPSNHRSHGRRRSLAQLITSEWSSVCTINTVFLQQHIRHPFLQDKAYSTATWTTLREDRTVCLLTETGPAHKTRLLIHDR